MSVVFLWEIIWIHFVLPFKHLYTPVHPTINHMCSHPGFPHNQSCAHTPVLPIIDHMPSYPVLPTIHHMCSHPILPTINHIVISEHHNDLLVSKIYKVWWPLQFYLDYKIWLKHMNATTKGHSLLKPRGAVVTLFHVLLEKQSWGSDLWDWLFYSPSQIRRPDTERWKPRHNFIVNINNLHLSTYKTNLLKVRVHGANERESHVCS